MGQLILLHRTGRKPAGRAAPPEGAQLVLFTGVRYEREAPHLPGKPPHSARPKRKRG